MGIQIVFETHSISEDNENGIATGWHHGHLSEKGRVLAKELGERRRTDGIQTVFTSDLRRAVETAEIALGHTSIPILHDWRLRECNYGMQNGMPRAELHRTQRQHLDEPYPAGESWRQAVQRVEHYLNSVPLEDLIAAEFQWRPGWEYLVS